MIAVPGQSRTSLGEPVPATTGLALEAAPRQLHQVERGQEVGIVAVGGVEDAAFAELRRGG